MESEQVKNSEDVSEEAESKSGKLTARGRFVRNICYIALFAAVLTVCAWISIPISGIAITLQTMGVCMASGFLGWKRGTVCVIAYILLGVCCVPVFSGFKNFYALIAGPSAGYVVGFMFTSLIVGLTSDKLRLIGAKCTDKIKSRILQITVLAVSMAVGIAVCYVFGTLWFMLIYKGSVTAENLQVALTFCVYPYLIPDLIKIIAATVLVDRLKKYVK